MPQPHVGFLDRFHPEICATIVRALPEGWTYKFAASKEPADQVAAAAGIDLLFVMAAPVTPDILAAAPNLRFIQKLGAGVDRIDLKTCEQRGIAVARLAGGNAVPVAEHALLMMLASLRRLVVMDRRTRAGEWDKESARGVNRQLSGKRVGLVGFGAIGKALAKMLSGFDIELFYFDPIVQQSDVEKQYRIRSLPLDELLQTCDIVSLHLPLMPETAGMISRERIYKMKRGAVLVNCARGGLIDEDALVTALNDGQIFAAGLDAFSKEPPIGSPLLTMEQTVVTPHLGGATVDNFKSVIEKAVQNSLQYLDGKGLPKADVVFMPKQG